MAGKAKCGECAFTFLYTSTADYIRKLDEHYEDEHPGTRAERSEMGYIGVECPHCRASFSAATAKSVNGMLDRHIEEKHPEKLQGSEKIFWSASDLEMLRGMRISPE